MNTNKKNIWLPAIIVLAVVVYVVFTNTGDTKNGQKYFPNKIGEYTLFGEPSKKVAIINKCNKIEENSILKGTGRTGDACMETLIGEYHLPIGATTSIIQVNLSRFTQAGDMLQLLVDQSKSTDKFAEKYLFRFSPFEVDWSPESTFDLIVTKEGKIITGTSTVTSEFSGIATGSNEVVKYFISKFKPKVQ